MTMTSPLRGPVDRLDRFGPVAFRRLHGERPADHLGPVRVAGEDAPDHAPLVLGVGDVRGRDLGERLEQFLLGVLPFEIGGDDGAVLDRLLDPAGRRPHILGLDDAPADDDDRCAALGQRAGRFRGDAAGDGDRDRIPRMRPAGPVPSGSRRPSSAGRCPCECRRRKHPAAPLPWPGQPCPGRSSGPP